MTPKPVSRTAPNHATAMSDGASKSSRSGPTENSRVTEEAEPERPKGRKRKSARGDRQKLAILKAAFECFTTAGFDATTTRQIAHKAKVSHTAVPYYFRSKDKLWIATMEMAIAQYINMIRGGFAERHNIPAKDALQNFIREFVTFSARSPGVHRMLSMESAQGTERLNWIIDHYLRDHFTVIRDLIRRGQAEGSVREGDPTRLYYFILSAGSAPFTLSSEYQALTGRDVFSEAEVFQTIGFIYEMVFTSNSK